MSSPISAGINSVGNAYIRFWRPGGNSFNLQLTDEGIAVGDDVTGKRIHFARWTS